MSAYHHPQEEDDGAPNPCFDPSQSMSVEPRGDMGLIDERNKNQNLDRNQDQSPDPKPKQTRFASQLKKRNRQPPENYVHAEDYDDENYYVNGNVDGAIKYIEEALKGADMNKTWRRTIFSQRPEDDDEELRKQIDDELKHYHPDIAHLYWHRVRYSILERRLYNRDVRATRGFEVGYYPYLMCGGMIIRYYCPPDTNLPDEAIARLHGLANHAISIYNSTMGTNYYVVKVIKTMTNGAAGIWYFMTFQASMPGYDDHLWTFEAKVFESFPLPESYILVAFVRVKDGAPSSSPEPPYEENLILPLQCCSSSSSRRSSKPFSGR